MTTATMRREFEALVLPLHDSLYGAAMRLTRNPAEAEDLVQDALVRAWRFWDSFQQGTNIKAWMFTILHNTFINGHHRRNRKRSFESDVNAQMCSLGPSVAIGNTTSEPPGPEESMETLETRRRIEEALACIPEDYRRAITLCDLEGLSYKEIAVLMDCPIGTVMSRIYRGRKHLYRALYDLAEDRGMVDGSPCRSRPSTRRRVVGIGWPRSG